MTTLQTKKLRLLLQNYPKLVNSRMIEICDYADFDPPEQILSKDSCCSKCSFFEIELSDCHICGKQYCHRCVWYFILPEKFYRKDIINFNTNIRPPLSVCWGCHDKSIYHKVKKTNNKQYIGRRNNLVIKKVENKYSFFPPKTLPETPDAFNKICIVCDSQDAFNHCQLCGEIICDNCSIVIFTLPDEYRVNSNEEQSYACRECHFKLCGFFELGTWYNTSFSIKAELIRSSCKDNEIIDPEGLTKMEIKNEFEAARSFVQEELKASKVDDAPGECFLCQSDTEKSPCAICRVCDKKVCSECFREFYLPKKEYGTKRGKSVGSAPELSPRVFSLKRELEEDLDPSPVCFRCHEIALFLRSLYKPLLREIRQRDFLRIDAQKQQIFLPPLTRSQRDTPEDISCCFFCKIDSSLNKQECQVCAEYFCPDDITTAAIRESKPRDGKPVELAISLCLDCRQFIAVKKFHLVYDGDEDFVWQKRIESSGKGDQHKFVAENRLVERGSSVDVEEVFSEDKIQKEEDLLEEIQKDAVDIEEEDESEPDLNENREENGVGTAENTENNVFGGKSGVDEENGDESAGQKSGDSDRKAAKTDEEAAKTLDGEPLERGDIDANPKEGSPKADSKRYYEITVNKRPFKIVINPERMIVEKVGKKSEAFDAGVRRGDTLLNVNGKKARFKMLSGPLPMTLKFQSNK